MILSVAANLGLRLFLANGYLDTYGLQAVTLGIVLGPLCALIVLIALGDRSFLPEAFPWMAIGRTLFACGLILCAVALGRSFAAMIMPEATGNLRAVLSLSCSALAGGGILTFLVRRYSLIKHLRS